MAGGDQAEGRRGPVTVGAQDQDGRNLLRDIWHVLVKRYRLLLSILALCLVIGLVITLLSTPIYQAETTLQIDREAAQIVEVKDMQPVDDVYSAQEFYQTQYGLLKSRAVAQRVVNQLQLAQDQQFIDHNRMTRRVGAVAGGLNGSAPGASNRLAVEKLMKHLHVIPTVNSRLVKVSYDSPDPVLAQQVVNAVADAFIASNLERRFEASSYARQFLGEQLQQLRDKLQNAYRAVVAEAGSEHLVNLPTGDSSNAQGGMTANIGRSLTGVSLEGLNSALQGAHAARVETENRWKVVAGAQGLTAGEVQSSPVVQTLKAQQAVLAAQYEDLLHRFSTDYPSVQNMRKQLDEMDRQIRSDAADVRESVRLRYVSALADEQALQKKVDDLQHQAIDEDRRAIPYYILTQELASSQSLYDGLLERYKQVAIAGGVGTNNVSIVDRAELPYKPVQPKPAVNMALAGLFGLLLGGLAAFGVEYLDDTIRSPDELEAKLKLPFLGAVPLLPAKATPTEAIEEPRSPFSEAMHSIRSAIQFARASGAPRTLLITSSNPREGKSTVAGALAETFARSGKTVLLIDGDLRDPVLHKLHDLPNRVGLSSILTGSATLVEATQQFGHDRLSLITSGPRPPSPAELLSSPQLARMLADASELYDIVIIDGPPIMGFADAPIMAQSTEGVLFVVAATGVRRPTAVVAIARLRAVNAQIYGGVLQKFDITRMAYGGYGYEYAYSYAYGADQPKTTSPGA